MSNQRASLKYSRRPRPLWTTCCGFLFLGGMISLIVGALTDPGPSKDLQLASRDIQTGNYAQAEAVLKGSLQRYPRNSAVTNELAWALYLDHKYAEAEPYAVRSVARARRANNLDTLAHVELGLGKVDTAAVGFKEALDLEPKNGDSLEGLGQIAERRGRLDEALSLYTRARGYKPTIKGIEQRIDHVQQQLQQQPKQPK